MSQAIAIVDCNNFYASCERIFQPRLQNLPIVVLSNNDGCAVARSDEAKALGIKMGQPFFEFKHLVKRYGIQVFSSNYALYGDMSARMGMILEQFSDDIEIYSIDEAFLNFTGFQHLGLTDYGHHIRKKIKQQIGLPVSVGIGPTKTLAKLANHYAKKNKNQTRGVLDLCSTEAQDEFLPQLDIEKVWGIGRRWAAKLRAHGIETVQDLKTANLAWIRKNFNVILLRTVYELNGEPCFAFELEAPPKKEIVCSRSFGALQTDWLAIRSSVAHHVANASAKLRKQKSLCAGIYVFIRTNPFRKQDAQYGKGAYQPLSQPSSDTSVLMQHAMRALKQIYKEGYQYKKAGVMLYDLSPQNMQQLSLLETNLKSSPALMETLDLINLRYGKQALHYGLEKSANGWQMLRGALTPAYTTKWSDIPIVKAN